MILAADFGGTTIKLGIVRDGVVTTRLQLEAHADRPMSDRLEAVATAWEQLLKESGGTISECKGMALALPFIVAPKRPRVLGEFGKFPGAEAIDFDAWSRTRLGLPVALENDLRVALLGEWVGGAACGTNDAVMLAFGTGIGCAAISSGRLLRGANNRAATLLGHSTIAYEGNAGRCGNIGCAEDIASTATLPARAQALPGFAGSKLASAAEIDYEAVFAFAAEGDACSQALLKQSLKVWAVVVQNAVIAYDPDVVVLGGGVLRSREIVLAAMERHIHHHMPGLPFETRIAAAALGDDAALLGCEALFKQSHPSLFP